MLVLVAKTLKLDTLLYIIWLITIIIYFKKLLGLDLRSLQQILRRQFLLAYSSSTRAVFSVRDRLLAQISSKAGDLAEGRNDDLSLEIK